MIGDRLKCAARRLRRLLVDPTAGNDCIRAGVRFVCWNQIPGDYLEFGCGSGRTFVASYHAFRGTRSVVAAELSGPDRMRFALSRPRFFAFDTFTGLPEATGLDAHPYRPRHWREAAYACSARNFERALERLGVDAADVTIVDGPFEDTLTETTRASLGLTRAAMVYIDCDYYESTAQVLDFITDLVQDGTVLVFDDFNFFRGSPHLGQRRAFAEWLGRHAHIEAIELARHDFSATAFYLCERAGGARHARTAHWGGAP